MHKWQDRFAQFDRDNPHVYELFKRFTFELINAGHKVSSAELIVNRLRWETTIQTRGDRFKVNAAYRSFYARKFMQEFPQYGRFFHTRERPCT